MTTDDPRQPDAEPVPTAEPIGVRETLRQLGPAAPLAVAVTILPPLGSIGLIAIATTTSLAAWMRSNPSASLPLFVFAFWPLGICLLPTYSYSVLGGYAFGFWRGTLAALVAYAGACVLAFALARRIARDRVVPLVERHPKLAAIRHVLAEASFARSATMIGLLRISPASPFAVTNVVLGASGVSWGAYCIGTIVGVVPRTVGVVWIASRMSELSFSGGEDQGSRTAAYVATGVGILATVVVIGVIGRLARRELDRMTSRGEVPSCPID